MRVQRRRDGTVRLRLEHEDDLYHLDLLLEPGDAVRASTERREATQADRLRPGRGAKQKMTLTLAVEKVEYQPFGQRLRCHGPITEASRDVGQHHTLLLGAGDDLTLGKSDWAPHHKRRLREAAQAAVRALAVAVEADSVVLAGSSVDLYNPKTLRASVGSAFHLPVAVEPDPFAAVRAAQAAGLVVLAADGAGDVDLFEADELLARPTAWLFGNEAWGLPDDLAAAADHRVAIPIHGKAESLNLSTAAALCLYASARVQR